MPYHGFLNNAFFDSHTVAISEIQTFHLFFLIIREILDGLFPDFSPLDHQRHMPSLIPLFCKEGRHHCCQYKCKKQHNFSLINYSGLKIVLTDKKDVVITLSVLVLVFFLSCCPIRDSRVVYGETYVSNESNHLTRSLM